MRRSLINWSPFLGYVTEKKPTLYQRLHKHKGSELTKSPTNESSGAKRLYAKHLILSMTTDYSYTHVVRAECKQPGGSNPEAYCSSPPTETPSLVKANQLAGTAAGYKEQVKKDGIPFRKHGLFPPGDSLLAQLVALKYFPFEKHLPGPTSPYETLPEGGWITGNAAAQRGVDLRLFYKEPEGEERHGVVVGAVRLGNGAAIGTSTPLNNFYLSSHGGSIETVLDEATAEIAKIEFVPFLSTREITVHIKKPVPLHTTLMVKAEIETQKGIRCWVNGSIESSDGNEVVYATCKACLVDMRPFL